MPKNSMQNGKQIQYIVVLEHIMMELAVLLVQQIMLVVEALLLKMELENNNICVVFSA